MTASQFKRAVAPEDKSARRAAIVRAAEDLSVRSLGFSMDQLARRAGVGAIGVGWGYHEPQRLVQAGAHGVVAASGALLAAIDARLAVQERGA